jgi:hypothetical protein
MIRLLLSSIYHKIILIVAQKSLYHTGFSHLLLDKKIERVMGIEPTYPAWKAGVLPLNYTRVISDTSSILPHVKTNCKTFLYFFIFSLK